MMRVSKWAKTMALALGVLAGAAQAAWEPAKPVEFVVPAGTGGGADQMARFIQGVVAKHKLMKQSIVVVNKGGGAGAEGFLEVKGANADPHKLIITLSNLFTTPLATGVPFNWRDLTPVSMMALDQFILWVNAESPYKTAKEFLDALKSQAPNTLKMGGTGSKQEDQIITVMLENVAGKKMTYVPFKGGGDVAVQLVTKWRCTRCASTFMPQSTTRSRPSRIGGPASCGRCACSTRTSCPTPPSSRTACRGPMCRRALRPASRSST